MKTKLQHLCIAKHCLVVVPVVKRQDYQKYKEYKDKDKRHKSLLKLHSLSARFFTYFFNKFNTSEPSKSIWYRFKEKKILSSTDSLVNKESAERRTAVVIILELVRSSDPSAIGKKVKMLFKGDDHLESWYGNVAAIYIIVEFTFRVIMKMWKKHLMMKTYDSWKSKLHKACNIIWYTYHSFIIATCSDYQLIQGQRSSNCLLFSCEC